MSLVNTETGEIVEFDRAAAERRAERIRLRLDTIADNAACGMPTESEPCSEHQSEPVRENACKCPGSGTMAHVRGCRLHPEAGR